MSKKHCAGNYGLSDCIGLGSRKPTLPNLIILILILLQFNSGDWLGGKGGYHEGVDNGVLFIIALFYLSCCNPCKSGCKVC